MLRTLACPVSYFRQLKPMKTARSTFVFQSGPSLLGTSRVPSAKSHMEAAKMSSVRSVFLRRRSSWHVASGATSRRQRRLRRQHLPRSKMSRNGHRSNGIGQSQVGEERTNGMTARSKPRIKIEGPKELSFLASCMTPRITASKIDDVSQWTSQQWNRAKAKWEKETRNGPTVRGSRRIRI